MNESISQVPFLVFDENTGKLQRPTLLLETIDKKVIGEIAYDNLQISFVGKGLDELSFDVHKKVNGKECPFWDKLIDLCIIQFVDYGRFQAHVSLNDGDDTVKTCTCESLETELGQRLLRDFHVNDETAIELAKESDFDPNGKFIPTVLHDGAHPEHSLLHRVLAEKAPQWRVEADDFFNINGTVYEPSSIQRTFTVEDTSIYDFLEGDVSREFSCIFTYDTMKRVIHCHNLDECVYNTATKQVLEGAYKNIQDGCLYTKEGTLLDNSEYNYCPGIGTDTNIYVSKSRLAQSFNRDSDIGAIKNCFYVSGGDDVMTNAFAAANVTGDNRIFMFDAFQTENMPEELVNALTSYNELLEKNASEFYAEDGLYTRYCEALDEYYYLHDSKFPNTSLSSTTAGEQMQNIKSYFSGGNRVYITNTWNADAFAHVTGNIESVLSTIVDTRYDVEILSGDAHPKSCTEKNANNEGTWTGYVQITHATDENDKIIEQISVPIKKAMNNTDKLAFCQQKINIAISKLSIADLVSSLPTRDFSDDEDEREIQIAELANQMQPIFDQYNLTTLNSYYDGFQSCLATLEDLYRQMDLDTTELKHSYNCTKALYEARKLAADTAVTRMQEKVEVLTDEIKGLENEINAFREKLSMQNNFTAPGLWELFQSYIREDVYNNPNYVSDGLTDSELLQKAKELKETAQGELASACRINYTISGNLNDIFALQDLKELHDKFSLYNYIRCRVDDTIYKLRLIRIEFSENQPEVLNVTFSDKVELVGTDVISSEEKALRDAKSISTSYPSTVKQAKQAVSISETLQTIKAEGLNSAEYIIKNTNSEVINDNNGLLLRVMTDQGIYSDNQIRLTGNGMYLTSDNWKNVGMAVGTVIRDNVSYFGVITDYIVGDLIVGEKLQIMNKKGSVTISGEGIGIGSGYLCITGKKDPNSDISTTIEINPKGIHCDDHNDAYVFSVSKGDEVVMGVTNEGSGYFSGEVIMPKGKIGNWTIGNAIYNGTDSKDTTDGTYIGIDAIRQYNSSTGKYVHIENGKLTCNDVDISGVINATGGNFSGNITSTATIYGGEIEGANIRCSNSLKIYTEYRENILTPTKTSYETALDTYIAYEYPGTVIPDYDTCLRIGNGNFKFVVIANNAMLNKHLYLGDSLNYYIGSGGNGFFNNVNANLFRCETGEETDFSDPFNLKTVKVYQQILGYNQDTETAFVGNSNFETLALRGNTVRLGASGATVTSDERLKNSFEDLDKFDNVYMSLNPLSYKFNDGTSGRTHFGFGAGAVKQSLEENGFTTQDFGGFVQMQDNPNSEDYCGVDDPMGLIYTEFVAWNTHMIQKTRRELNALKEELQILKNQIK